MIGWATMPISPGWILFNSAAIRSVASWGAMVGSAALLLLLSFIGVAAIVTEWATPHRILTAWLVVLGWSICAGAAVYVARRLMIGSSPFAHVGSAISRDLSAIGKPGNTPN